VGFGGGFMEAGVAGAGRAFRCEQAATMPQQWVGLLGEQLLSRRVGRLGLGRAKPQDGPPIAATAVLCSRYGAAGALDTGKGMVVEVGLQRSRSPVVAWSRQAEDVTLGPGSLQ
jgi:hypothetical protein